MNFIRKKRKIVSFLKEAGPGVKGSRCEINPGDEHRRTGCLCQFTSRKNGISVTLTDGKFVSYDLDFIEQMAAGRRKLKRILSEIGFSEHNRYFRHPETEFFLEFPAGPLAVGNEPPASIVEIKYETGTLNILSSADCIKDRLSAFFYWDDKQCLNQAVQVALRNPIDLNEIERWAKKEGQKRKLKYFLQELN